MVDVGLGFQYWKLYQDWQKQIRNELKPLDLNYLEAVLLVARGRLPRIPAPYQNQLIAAININRMSGARALESLRAKGFIYQLDADLFNRKSPVITLTYKGRNILPEVQKIMVAGDQNLPCCPLKWHSK